MAEKIDVFKNLDDKIKALPKYAVEIGVISTNSKRRQTIKVGVTNAELMFIHENGSPLRGIPARPVLEMTIKWANENLLDKSISKAIDAYIDSDFDAEAYKKELEKMCIRIQSYARNIIYSNDGRLVPNATSTIRRKGDNHPLFDTGQLARSITCRLVEL